MLISEHSRKDVFVKVLLVNGSPHKNGCTCTVLMEIKNELRHQGIDADVFWIGSNPLSGCLGCSACVASGHCFMDDTVNEFINIVADYDAFIFGSPVHFAGPSGQLVGFMDRVFYHRTELFYGKPAAAICTLRRGGASATFDQINKYFAISNMVTVGSQYWNMVHGDTPEEVLQDTEGMQTMRTLARNMAWILKCIDAGKKVGIVYPGPEQPRVRMNYIR